MFKKIAPLEGMFRQIVPHDAMGISWLRYDEGKNVIDLSTLIGMAMVQLDSMQIRDISVRTNLRHPVIYPYRNFYTAGNTSLSTLHKLQ